MGRKFIGITIILIGVIIMAGLIYFVLLGNDYQNILAYFGFQSGVVEEVIPIKIDEKKDSNNTNTINNREEEEAAVNTTKRIDLNDGEEIINEKEKIAVESQIKPLERVFGKDDIKRMASSFAERFGTYSNQSDFSNILDLKIFMTREMQRWADSYVMDNRSIPQSADIYYGITTRSVAGELIEFDDELGSAKVVVSTRRQEARADRSNVSDIFNQQIEVELKKENGAWKIDQAFWKNR